MIRLGLDIGGTNLKWAALGPSDAVVASEKMPIDRGRSTPERILEHLHRITGQLGGPQEISQVGIGLPGRVDGSAGVVEYVPNLSGDWEGFPLAVRTRSIVDAPVHLANDVHMLANAELHLGAARDADAVLFVAVGTGVGGAIALNGQVLQGRTGVAGAIGHTTVVPDGPRCTCGNHGCLEALAAGPVIARSAGTATAAEAAEAANRGSPPAIDAWNRAGAYIGTAVASAVTMLWPELVVVGVVPGRSRTYCGRLGLKLSRA